MRFSIDQINDEICVLEEVNTGNMVEVNISFLPNPICEGSIVVLKNGVYELDVDDEKSRRLSLRERMNRLKKIKK